jgi:hypothetical protein
MFRAIMSELEAAGAVRLEADDARWPKRVLSLTPLGQALLAGDADWLAMTKAERWVGGVRIMPGRPCWRWDGERPVFV